MFKKNCKAKSVVDFPFMYIDLQQFKIISETKILKIYNLKLFTRHAKVDTTHYITDKTTYTK